jgi:hypothetical protein
VRHPPAGHRHHGEHSAGRFGYGLDPTAEQIPQGGWELVRAGPDRAEQLLGEERVALRPGEHRVSQLGRWRCAQDADQLRHGLGPVQPGQLHALDPVGAGQLGQVRAEALVARLVVAVGDHHQEPLAAQVPAQEREQVAGGPVGPVQVLQNQDQRGLLAQASQQSEQQLEQPSLRGLARWVRAIRLSQGGQQACELRPGGADQLADRFHADLTEQVAQDLDDGGVGQSAIADGHAAADEHPHPGAGAAAGAFRDQARLADTGLAPHQDDGRISVCGPLPGRLEELQLLCAADEGGARDAAAHLAGIIARDRPEGNGRRTRSATKDREQTSADVWQVPDSGGTPWRHPRPASNRRCSLWNSG